MDSPGWPFYGNAVSMSSLVEDDEDLDPEIITKKNTLSKAKTISRSRYSGDYEFQQKAKTTLSKDHPFFKPKVAPTLYQAISMVGWASQNLFSPAICQPPHATVYTLSLHNFMASSLSSPKPLMRFSCFSNTWIHPTGSIFHTTPFLNQNLYSCTSITIYIHYTSLSCSLPGHYTKHLEIQPHILFLSMENSSTPPTTTSTTTPPFSIFPPNSLHAAPDQGMQFRHSYPGHSFEYPGHHFMAGGSRNEIGWLTAPVPATATDGSQGPILLRNDGLNNQQERKPVLDPFKTKMARINRRMARQRSLSLQRNAPPALASSGAHSSNQEVGSANRNNTITKRDDMFTFCTPDNKRLRVLLTKVLKKSDVASLGRIVLPKREAEENLPNLSGKEGITITMRDVYSNQVWTVKYKFWINNKSRMYVLENTGHFVRQNGLKNGDSLTLYEDESENLYFSMTKAARMGPEYSRIHRNNNELAMSSTYQAGDEEESSLAILIEELSNKEQQQYSDIMALPMTGGDGYYPTMPFDQEVASGFPTGKATSSSGTDFGATVMPSTSKAVDDNQFMNFDDYYGDLDMIHDVDQYNFSP